jgi:hypothetical protein
MAAPLKLRRNNMPTVTEKIESHLARFRNGLVDYQGLVSNMVLDTPRHEGTTHPEALREIEELSEELHRRMLQAIAAGKSVVADDSFGRRTELTRDQVRVHRGQLEYCSWSETYQQMLWHTPRFVYLDYREQEGEDLP